MKKAFDQTVRDLKREVNKKVLKVPSIEQKVLDATSNEPWGPHGTLLADIAQATRNYHECQMIMGIIWKRINDIGKNWRHVYKALTVLEYLVGHGSERVIDEIREHAYQISTLSDFQYIDSRGKDQGNNVRKKSQSLVTLVNDKERVQEVRQKAAANRDKYRGSMNQPGRFSSSGGYRDRYDDDSYESRYGYRDDDHSGYGRDRDYRYGDDRDSNYGGSYGRDGDRYGRDYEDRYGRDGFRDDDYRGRGESIDSYRYGSRSRSADPGRERSYEEDGQYSSRGGGVKADYQSQDGSTVGKRLDRKFSEQNLSVPPTYEEALNTTRSPIYSERGRESRVASAPRNSSPPTVASPHAPTAAPPAPASPPNLAAATVGKDVDEFDPRGSFSDSLALVPVTEPIMTSEAMAGVTFTSEATFAATPSATSIASQPFSDPFGDGPFKAIPSTNNSVPRQQDHTTSANSFNSNSGQISDVQQPFPPEAGTEFQSTYDSSYVPSDHSGLQPSPPNQQSVQHELPTLNQDVDMLADILPTSVSSSAVSTGFSTPRDQPPSQTSHPFQSTESVPRTDFSPNSMAVPFPVQHGLSSQTNFPSQSVQRTYSAGFTPPTGSSHAGFWAPVGGRPARSYTENPNFYGSHQMQMVSTGPDSSSVFPSTSSTPTVQYNSQSQIGTAVPVARVGSPAGPTVSSMPVSRESSAVAPQPSKDKFETKSTVWTDTLSRGLVNLNISGSKTNPLADIGVDFDALNRKEKRMEKPTIATAASTITMGKAMGSGSGMGRAVAGSLRPPPNPTIGSGAKMNMSGVPQAGMGMAGGYRVNQPMVPGMSMGMAQGTPMQQQARFPPASTLPGSYAPMMGTGNYSQRQDGGGY